MGKLYDFSGYATRANVKCSDGRIIMKDAFKDCDGSTVPLVWNHQHNDPRNVLGHALLKSKDGDVYAYCSFNDSEAAETAKKLVKHGDICALSILANQLIQKGPNVVHGIIREVSLVLAGANPKAYIENVLEHGEINEESAIIYNDGDINLEHVEVKDDENMIDNTLEHADNTTDGESLSDIFDTLTEKQKNAVYEIVGAIVNENSSLEHKDSSGEETVADVFDTLTEKQKKVVYAIIGQLMEENDDYDDNDEEDRTMKHNIFDQNDEKDNVLSHDAMNTIIADAKRCGSMKESVLQHSADYGIEQIDYLFPDAQNVTKTPQFIQRDMGWVQKIMSTVHHTPFSRVKSLFANITEDEARAKGYMKGTLKKEEVFSLLKRTTTPTTIYKKQKMDRDDVIDITDFDVIAWLKTEMRMMLDEEIARAILIGDNRLASSDDKINEQNVRPIMKDEELYTIQALVTVRSGATSDERAKEFIRTAIKARKNYKGSGEPSLYTTEDMLIDCLLLEDTIGHALYADAAALARKLRVKEIVTVPVMEGVKGKNNGNLLGIIVNLTDYTVGADKGGAVNMFDDFDIDYNQQKYLIETRCSGALTKPYSAIALEEKISG